MNMFRRYSHTGSKTFSKGRNSSLEREVKIVFRQIKIKEWGNHHEKNMVGFGCSFDASIN